MEKPKLTVVVLLAMAVCVGFVSFSPGGVHASGTTYYLDSQNGNDSNSGSSSAPWQTIAKAVSSIQGGDTVVLAGGLYTVTSPFYFKPSGSPSGLTTFKSAPGARPIITDAWGNPPSVYLGGDYMRLDGLWIGGKPELQSQFGGHLIGTGGNPISHGNEIVNCTLFGYWGGIVTGSSEYLLIQNNRFVNDGGGDYAHGIYVSSGTSPGLTQHVIVDHNLFVGRGGGYGAQQYGASGGVAHNLILTRNLIAGHEQGSTTWGSDNLIANNFYWKENGVPDGHGGVNLDSVWGHLVSDINSQYYNNIFETGGWAVMGYQFPPRPSWTQNIYDHNAHQLTGKPPAAMYAITGTNQVNLTFGQEQVEYGITAQELDSSIAALQASFNQTVDSILIDQTIEPNFAKLNLAQRIPQGSPLYHTGNPWFGQPVNVGPDASAPATATDFWSAFRALGLTEYDRFGQVINGAPPPTAATATSTSTGIAPSATPMPAYSLTFSTLMGGSGEDSARGVDVDAAGNIYVAGGTSSSTFPITEGPSYQNNGSQCGSLGTFGKMDVFVTKFSPSGQLVWSRLIDTPCYARAYAVHVDSSGFVYVGGRAGDHFPTTQGSIQPSFPGSKTNPSAKYGAQSGFIAKLSPDGSQIIWASYFGENDQGFLRDIALDSAGNVFLAEGDVSAPNPLVSGNAFQTTLGGGTDLVAAKISNDGTRVIWATYFGGSADDGIGPSVRIDNQDEPLYFASTNSSNLPVSANAFQRTFGGTIDGYLVKFTPDGSSLVFSTYLGGSGEDSTETHHLALDSQGNALVSMYTNSTDFPTTSGAYQRTLGGGYDFGLAKFSPTGSLLAATYLGGSGAESPQGMSVDSHDNPVLFGSSASSSICASNESEFIARLDPSLSQLLTTKCIGGSQIDQARDGVVDANDNLIAVGWTQSTDFPLVNPIQSTFGGVYDVTVLKIGASDPPGNTPTATATPTRTSTGTLIPPSATPTYAGTATDTPGSPSPTPTGTVYPTDPPPTMITVQENDPSIQYDAWLGVKDQGASGGSYRVSKVVNNTARFTFKGTSVKWISQRGPDQGFASVSIDGVNKAVVDLYNPTTQYQWSKTFGSLSYRTHTLVVKVLGTKNPYSADANVVVDAFVAGGTTVQEDNSALRFDNWQADSNTNSNGGTYRVNSTAGSINRFTFSGTGVEWITAKGPTYGKANVFIDGIRIGDTLDLYAKTQQWQLVISFSGLAPGPHTIEIRPLGVKNPASKGKGIVIDAFRAAPPPP